MLAFHSINRDGSFYRLSLFYALMQGPTSLYFILLFLVEHEKKLSSLFLSFENGCRSSCYFGSVFFNDHSVTFPCRVTCVVSLDVCVCA